jgi:hypothetical protein
MPHTTSNPIHKRRIPRLREHAPILSSSHSLPSIFPSLSPIPTLHHTRQLPPPPLLLDPPLPLRPIIQQKRQRARQRQNNQTLEYIRVYIRVVVVVVVARAVLLLEVVVCEFGFEEGGEPLG